MLPWAIVSWPLRATQKFGGTGGPDQDKRLESGIEIQHAPVAKTEMLIRKSVSEVFEAFVDPAITCNFWFAKGSGRLAAGKQIRWDWEMYSHSIEVEVKAIDENRRILVEWGNYDARTTVEWLFTSRPDNTTLVSITNSVKRKLMAFSQTLTCRKSRMDVSPKRRG